MKHRAIRIALTCLALLLAFGGLLWSTLRADVEYYKHVEEVMVNPGAWEGKNLQLHGAVVPGSIERRRGSLDYRFRVESKGMVVSAVYTGILPDTFQDDAEVVLRGTLQQDGFHVEPNGVMAKCPSKYEARKSGAAPAPRPGAE